ncbi:hypothetical protein ACFZCK_14135 [Kitasatospora purpeofusca]|uniref:hypothetical protein n=1 Tax=Kitasatospora purpeofusca TaxID=67352 RepID=UPI0036E893C9
MGKRLLTMAAGMAVAMTVSWGAYASAPKDEPHIQVSAFDDDSLEEIDSQIISAFDRIGSYIQEQCGNGPEPCHKALSTANGMELGYGGDPITFYEDGSFSIGNYGK